MYVYGGINNEGKYLQDIWSLNLKTFVWQRVTPENDKLTNGIAFH